MAKKSSAASSYQKSESTERICTRSNAKFALMLYSTLVSAMLVVLSILGFKHAGNRPSASIEEMEETTSFGSLCFLGLCFGLLLFLGEFKIQVFFVHFGFLRFRIGRAVVHLLAGVLVLLMGKSLGSQCKCKDYTALILQGAAMMLACVAQICGVFCFGATTAPRPEFTTKDPVIANHGAESAHQRSALKPIDEPVTKPNPVNETKASTPPESFSNMPAWMQV